MRNCAPWLGFIGFRERAEGVVFEVRPAPLDRSGGGLA